MSESDWAVNVDATVIGPAMEHRIAHSREMIFVDANSIEAQYSNDSAHCLEGPHWLERSLCACRLALCRNFPGCASAQQAQQIPKHQNPLAVKNEEASGIRNAADQYLDEQRHVRRAIRERESDQRHGAGHCHATA